MKDYAKFKESMKHIHKGGLHQSLGIPQGQKIPAKRLTAALHSDSPKVRKQAQLAKTFKGMKH